MVSSVTPSPTAPKFFFTSSHEEKGPINSSSSEATTYSSVIVVDEDAVVSARLVAVAVTVCAVVMVAGAVYRPDVLIEPTPTGLIDHVTALLAVLATFALSCAVWPLLS